MTDHGVTRVFEDQGLPGIGDMELAPSNPAIIYLGSRRQSKS